MAVKTPALLFNVAEEIRECVCRALTDEGTCGCPCKNCVIIGEPANVGCCDGGQLSVSLERLYIHGNFPQPDNSPALCFSPLAADYKVTLLRCAPTVKDDGTLPSCPELSDSALSVLTDLYVVERALICCLAAAKRMRKFVMRDARTIGPSGGCVGFELSLTIEIEDTLSD